MNPLFAGFVTLLLVVRARSHNSLTPLGIAAAVATAIVHAIHPWSVFFWLLIVFYASGNYVTKVHKEAKAKLTASAAGGHVGGEEARTHVQVFANSLAASILILLHWWFATPAQDQCVPRRGISHTDLLVFGIVGNYVAVAADTFSSELGILSSKPPFLVTKPWISVPPGTNGGVTSTGIAAGIGGAAIVAAAATVGIPFCSDWSLTDRATFFGSMVAVGLSGSLIDSILGACLQATVIDVRSGKVLEGQGGGKVLYVPRMPDGSPLKEKAKHPSRKVIVGLDVLSNNGVNLAMAATMSVAAMISSSYLFGAI